MPVSKLRLLGDFAIEIPPGAMPIRLGRKGQALLGCVAMHGSAGVSRDRLVSLLWPDRSDEDARGALRQCLLLVRRLLEPVASDSLISDGQRIILRDDGFEVDVRSFVTLVSRDDLDAMLAAAELYRGEFLENLNAGAEFGLWAGGERERLRDVAHALVARLSEVAVGADAHEATVRLVHRLLASDPVHEGCYRALMRLYARAGLQAKAMQAWNDCRRVLQSELGVEPSSQTAAVAQQMRVPSEPAFTGGTPARTTAPDRVPMSAAPAEDPSVIDIMLRGRQLFDLFTAETNAQARTAFQAAVARMPDHSEAIAMVGWTHWFDSISGWTSEPALSYRYAGDCAARAIDCNRGDPNPHMLQGKVLLWRMEYDAALDQLRHAAALAPGHAYAHFNLGDALTWSGQSEEALGHVDRALELHPNEFGVFLTIRGLALWMKGDLENARSAFRSAIRRNPGYAWAHSLLGVVHMEGGDAGAARENVATACALYRRLSLSFSERVLPFRVPEHRERHTAAWRAAGMRADEAPGGFPVGPPPFLMRQPGRVGAQAPSTPDAVFPSRRKEVGADSAQRSPRPERSSS